MERKGSILYSRELTAGIYPEPDKSIPHSFFQFS
jgi:hypothetical protein